MHRHALKRACGPSVRPLVGRLLSNRTGLRSIATTADYEAKYADKLRQRAEEQGLNVDQLKAKVKEEQAEEARRKRELKARLAAEAAANAPAASAVPKEQPVQAPLTSSVRKDSSPVKPLSSILNLSKIMQTPCTSEQIGALWTAYHASRSGGTGRGYVCASIPVDLYNKMAGVAERYPAFIVPIPRVKPTAEPVTEGEEDTAYEFYFLQWDFHDVPPVPTETEDIFAPRVPTFFSAGANPKISTVLFTPLQEYKLRAAFATPYIVLTHYTDLASSHGIVLLRGEITPTTAAGGAGEARYMVSQEDAQMLSMAVQKFYLWDGKDEASEGGRLLRCFHESPEDFQWEELLKHAKWTV
ncbi:putative ATP11 protein [Lyophyllum shimeji]|uniref:ATP11 protein n=1 Tax=Lyophyllum shimeji TaxID=47721 RepID=A0A9P3PI15_LYOSH|nr:putative ATP11 protein [Lyophyllum shimeji]